MHFSIALFMHQVHIKPMNRALPPLADLLNTWGKTMNTHFANLAFHTVSTAVKSGTLRQVCGRMERGGHTLFVLTDILHIDEETEIHLAIRTLDKLFIREQAKRGHWSFSQNQLVMLKQHHDALCKALGKREAA